MKVRLGGREFAFLEIKNCSFAKRQAQLKGDVRHERGLFPEVGYGLRIEIQLAGYIALLFRKLVAWVVARVRFVEEIGVFHFNARTACAQSGGAALPFGIMVSDITQPKFCVMPKSLPGKIKRFAIRFGKHRIVDICDRAKVIKIVSTEITPRVAARTAIEMCAFFGNTFCFGCDRSMVHREVCAIAYGPAIFPQMISIGKKEKLECFHLVEFSNRRATRSFVGEVIEGLGRFPHRREDLESGHRHEKISTYSANVRANIMAGNLRRSSSKLLEIDGSDAKQRTKPVTREFAIRNAELGLRNCRREGGVKKDEGCRVKA